MNEPHTVAEWLDALQLGGWKGKRSGSEWKGPCPRCGGHDRFHAPPGAVLHIAEGEIDAESLREAGETCTMGTPGTTWRLEWTRGVVGGGAGQGRCVV